MTTASMLPSSMWSRLSPGLQVIVMGGGAGGLRGGQHLTYSDDPGMANLLVTLMDKMGVPVDKIGASTGALPLEPLAGI